MATDFLITPKQVCKILSISQRTLYRMIEKGMLEGFKVGGVWRFREKDIETYLETTRVSPNRVFQNSVLLRYLDDPKEYQVTKKGKTGIIRLTPKYRAGLSEQERQRLGFTSIKYQKVRGSTGASFVSVPPREFNKLPKEEQRHWLRLEIT